MNDPTLPQIVVTIDPDTGRYEGYLPKTIRTSILIAVFKDLFRKAEARSLPVVEEIPADV